MVRRTAVRILGELDRDPATFASERIAEACRAGNLKKRDRRFLHELVLGVLRRRMTLDAILRAYSKVRPDDMERAVLETLRLGVYQLLFLDGVPTFAAIHETVSAFKGPAKTRSFINAVLRAIDRDCRRIPESKDRGGASPRKRLWIHAQKVAFFGRAVFTNPEVDRVRSLAEQTSHAPFLAGRWLERWGDETGRALLEANNRVPPLTVRVNRLRGSRDELLERLRRDGLRCDEGGLVDAVRVDAPAAELVRSKTFRTGLCTVQDETAMKVAPRLEAAEGENVLDLCAAPGGKTTHLAELTGDQAHILAVDRDERRLDRLRESVERLGLKSVSVAALDLMQSDIPEGLPRQFDRVLIDAPCSNTGVLARRPEARYRFDERGLAALCEIQRGLLEAVAPRIRPGGVLVYSTCSLEPEENTVQVREFLARHPVFRWRDSEESIPTDHADGGFLAVLDRSPDAG